MQAVYSDLNQIARRFLAGERGSHTLDPTALVHELWIRLTTGTHATIQDRTHFFALAAKTMRHILVDHARARAAEKRGGARQQVSLTAVDGSFAVGSVEDLLSLDEALSELEDADPRAAKIVELRFFGGLNGAEIAAALDVAEITVKRDWRAARAWLSSKLSDLDPKRTRS